MEEAAVIQIGSVEEDTFEIIDLIHKFYLSADFSNWLTDGRFAYRLLQEHQENGKYTRVFQHNLDGSVFLNGTKEFYTEKIERDVIEVLAKNQAPITSKDLFFSKIKKINISKVIAEPHYTVISHLYAKGEVIGISWEMYDLSKLIHIYKQKDDPIRYWRRDRRE